MNEIKCKGCHFEDNLREYLSPRCSVINGANGYPCDSVRAPYGICGPDAKLFRPKQVEFPGWKHSGEFRVPMEGEAFQGNHGGMAFVHGENWVSEHWILAKDKRPKCPMCRHEISEDNRRITLIVDQKGCTGGIFYGCANCMKVTIERDVK